MKKLFFIFFSFVLFVILSASLILFPNNTAYAENTESDEENSEETIEETVQEIIDETDLSEYEDFVNNLKLPDDYTLSGLLDSVLNNNYELDFNYLTSYILKCFLGNIKGLIIQSLIILTTVVLMSILNNLTSGFSKTSTKKIVYLACYGTIIVIVGIMVGSAIESSGKMISDVEKFSNVSFPALLTLVTAIGANASAAVYQPLVLIFSSLMIKIINYIVMPAFFISFVFNIIGNLSDDLKLSKISGFAKSAGEWIIGISFGLFITYTTAQGITGAGIDSLATKGAKYALGSYIPVIGGYLKDGFDLITAGCIVIKNALGFVSLIILLFIAIIPIMRILSTMLILRLTAAISEPFGDKKITDMLHGVSKSLVLPLVACICIVFSLLIIIMLIILTCNRGVI